MTSSGWAKYGHNQTQRTRIGIHSFRLTSQSTDDPLIALSSDADPWLPSDDFLRLLLARAFH
jgi:hypothetical protein